MSSTFSSTSYSNVPIRAFITEITSTDPALSSFQSVVSPGKFKPHHEIAVSEFAVLLRKLNVPGPYHTFGDRQYIASGAQFSVYKQWVYLDDDEEQEGHLHLSAIKVPKFLLDANAKLDLSKPNVARQVRDLMVEISALRHSKLRDHANIVDLFGWGLDELNWHGTPFLIVDFTHQGDLNQVFKKKFDLSTETRASILSDVGRGIDAIHDVGLIHGDLKPENILMFLNWNKWTAKLSDFGGGAGLEEGLMLRGRGTVGWRAPELRQHHDRGEPLIPKLLDALDSYSYGLLIWNLLCGLDGAPSGGEEIDAPSKAVHNLRAHEAKLGKNLQMLAEQAVKDCLAQNATQRVTKIGGILEKGSMSAGSPAELKQKLRWEPASPVLAPWELPDIDPSMAIGIQTAFLTDKTSVAPELAFDSFLQLVDPFLAYDDVRRTSVLGLLREAAYRGLEAAKAICVPVHDCFEALLEPGIESRTEAYLFDSIASGVTILRSRAEVLDAERCEYNTAIFRKSGGFNRQYGNPPTDILHNLPYHIRTAGYSQAMTWLSCYDDLEASYLLKQHVTSGNSIFSPMSLNLSLYHACLAGASKTVEILLSLGADASIRPSPQGQIPLHWLFMFPASDTNTIARQLLNGSASIDTKSLVRVKTMHFPFSLPTGTPLHWAVELSCPAVVSALLSLGADLTLRTRVYWGGNWSRRESKQSPIEHNAVEIAVANWDYEILDMLLSHERYVTSENMDETGLGAVHKLNGKTYLQITPKTQVYSRIIFGSYHVQVEKAKKTVDVMLKHDLNLNMLTGTERSGSRTRALKLAVDSGDLVAVEALLYGGADINGRDSLGETPLMSLKSVAYDTHPALQIQMLDLMLPHRPDIEARTNNGNTALTLAALRRHMETVSVLLRHGASPLLRFQDPDDLANGLNVFALLWICDPSNRVQHDKKLAGLRRDYLLPLLRGEHDVELNLTDHALNDGDLGGSTLLHYMAQYCHYECCSVLLDAGADVNCLRLKAGFKIDFPGALQQYRTPLDEALAYRTYLENSLAKTFSKTDAMSILKDVDHTIDLLRSKGAKESANSGTGSKTFYS